MDAPIPQGQEVPQPKAVPNQHQEIQNVDEAIGSFARGFLSDLERNPDVDSPRTEEIQQQQEQQQPEGEVEAEEVEQPEAEAPSREPEIPLVEIELEDGQKYQVPEKLKGHFMRDKDYRQKTAEIAQERKQLGQATATANQVIAQARQMAPYFAQLTSMDNQMQQMVKALQSPELQQDPVEFNRVQSALVMLRMDREQFAGQLGQYQQQVQEQQNRLRGEALAAAMPKLREAIPSIESPQTQKALREQAVSEGFSEAEMDYIAFSPTAIKTLWKAREYDRLIAEQKASASKLQQKVKTLPAAQASRAPDKGAQSQQLEREWKKGGGKINDPAFDALLRQRLRGK